MRMRNTKNDICHDKADPSWIAALSWQRDLSNSEKLWAMPCRDTEDRQVIVESSDWTRSTWSRNWQATPVSLPRKLHEHKQKATIYDTGTWRRLFRVPWTARRTNLSILKEIKPWVLTGRTNPEAEDPILWPSHEKRRLLGKDLDVGKVWRQEEKGTTEDEMVGQCHWSNQHEFDPTPGGSGR